MWLEDWIKKTRRVANLYHHMSCVITSDMYHASADLVMDISTSIVGKD